MTQVWIGRSSSRERESSFAPGPRGRQQQRSRSVMPAGEVSEQSRASGASSACAPGDAGPTTQRPLRAGAAPNGAAGLAAWLMTYVHLLAILDACSDFWIETVTPGEAPQAARPMVRPCL